MMDRFDLDLVQKYMDRDAMSQPDALAKFMCDRIDGSHGDPENAFLDILDRLCKLASDEIFPAMVCLYIAISRNGLREIDIQGVYSKEGTEFTAADFSWLRQMLRGFFAQGDHLQWDFSHQSLRRAMKNTYGDNIAALNDSLINNFLDPLDGSFNDFILRELMHHLCIGHYPDLAASALESCESGNSIDEERMQLLGNGLIDAYYEHENAKDFIISIPKEVLDNKDISRKNYWVVMDILFNVQKFFADSNFRIALLNEIIEVLKGQDFSKSLKIIFDAQKEISLLYNDMGETKKANEYMEMSRGTNKELNRKRGVKDAPSEMKIGLSLETAENYDAEAIVLLKTDPEKALEKIMQSVSLKESLYEKKKTLDNLNALSYSYNILGVIYGRNKNTDMQEHHFRKAAEGYDILHERWGMIAELSHLPHAYYNLGDVLANKGDTAGAIMNYKKSIEAQEELFDNTGDQSVLAGLIEEYDELGAGLKHIKH